MYYHVSNLEYKYETLKEANVRLKSNSPLTDNQVKERQFKEDSYIRQQSNDTTLILLVFTIALGLTAFLTVVPTRREFDARITSLEKEYTNYSTNINNKHNDFEFRLDYSQANDYIGLYNKSVIDKDKEYCLFYAVLALSSFVDSYLSSSEKSDEEFKVQTATLIKNILDELLRSTSYKVSVELSGIITNSINNVRKLSNIQFDILLSKLQSSIEYEIRKIN
jgi:hypothetical protein